MLRLYLKSEDSFFIALNARSCAPLAFSVSLADPFYLVAQDRDNGCAHSNPPSFRFL